MDTPPDRAGGRAKRMIGPSACLYIAGLWGERPHMPGIGHGQIAGPRLMVTVTCSGWRSRVTLARACSRRSLFDGLLDTLGLPVAEADT
jgi:hypothetical protein